MGISEIDPRARGWANSWSGNQPKSLGHGGLDGDDQKFGRGSFQPKDGPEPERWLWEQSSGCRKYDQGRDLPWAGVSSKC